MSQLYNLFSFLCFGVSLLLTPSLLCEYDVVDCKGVKLDDLQTSNRQRLAPYLDHVDIDEGKKWRCSIFLWSTEENERCGYPRAWRSYGMPSRGTMEKDVNVLIELEAYFLSVQEFLGKRNFRRTSRWVARHKVQNRSSTQETVRRRGLLLKVTSRFEHGIGRNLSQTEVCRRGIAWSVCVRYCCKAKLIVNCSSCSYLLSLWAMESSWSCLRDLTPTSLRDAYSVSLWRAGFKKGGEVLWSSFPSHVCFRAHFVSSLLGADRKLACQATKTVIGLYLGE